MVSILTKTWSTALSRPEHASPQCCRAPSTARWWDGSRYLSDGEKELYKERHRRRANLEFSSHNHVGRGRYQKRQCVSAGGFLSAATSAQVSKKGLTTKSAKITK